MKLPSNMPKLHQSDPGWGRLLSQADRRIVVQSKSLSEILQGTRLLKMAPRMCKKTQNWFANLSRKSIISWWDDEPEDRARRTPRCTCTSAVASRKKSIGKLLLRMRHRLTSALVAARKENVARNFQGCGTGYACNRFSTEQRPLGFSPFD
jgi:hypothetical protein